MHTGEPQKTGEGAHSSEVQIFSGNRILWDVMEGLSRMIVRDGRQGCLRQSKICHVGRASDKVENQSCPQLWQRSN